MANLPTISVVVPAHRADENLRRCLSALSRVSPAPIEVIVVADGAAPEIGPLARGFGFEARELPGPSGPACARNLGARCARGEIALFVDADVEVRPDVVGQVGEAFALDPGLDALFGSYDDEPAAANFLSQYKNLLHHHVHQSSREEASTFWGAVGAIRRDVLFAHGGFDERYRRPSIEDVELGYRLTRAGGRIRLIKALTARHLKRWTVSNLLASDFFRRAIPWTRLILRDGRAINDLNLNTASRCSVLLAFGALAAAALSPWQPWALLAAAAQAALLFLLNLPLYAFFAKKRGWLFALRAFPWHAFYFLYGGAGFAVGAAAHLLSPRRGPAPAADSSGRSKLEPGMPTDPRG